MLDSLGKVGIFFKFDAIYAFENSNRQLRQRQDNISISPWTVQVCKNAVRYEECTKHVEMCNRHHTVDSHVTACPGVHSDVFIFFSSGEEHLDHLLTIQGLLLRASVSLTLKSSSSSKALLTIWVT